MSSFSLLIVPVIWVIALGIILYFRARNEEELNPPVTERRRQERRRPDDERLNRRVDDDSKFDSGDQRGQESDRRQNKTWRNDYDALKDKLEQDGSLNG